MKRAAWFVFFLIAIPTFTAATFGAFALVMFGVFETIAWLCPVCAELDPVWPLGLLVAFVLLSIVGAAWDLSRPAAGGGERT